MKVHAFYEVSLTADEADRLKDPSQRRVRFSLPVAIHHGPPLESIEVAVGVDPTDPEIVEKEDKSDDRETYPDGTPKYEG